jgi:hypothetical protein
MMHFALCGSHDSLLLQGGNKPKAIFLNKGKTICKAGGRKESLGKKKRIQCKNSQRALTASNKNSKRRYMKEPL